MHVALRAGIETGIILAVTAPAIAIGMWRRPARAWLPLVAFIALFALDKLVLRLPRVGPFEELVWNWQGKLLELAWVIAVVAAARRLTLRDIGVVAPCPGWFSATLPVAIATLALPLAFLPLGARVELTAEGWLFQATMPGLAEELVFRGVLLELCDRAFGRPWRIADADVGWGLIVTTILFAAVHSVHVDRDGALHVYVLLAAGPLVGGLLAGWARARIGSVVPVAVLHNLSNLMIPLATLALPA
jgi:uncharacterized protein